MHARSALTAVVLALAVPPVTALADTTDVKTQDWVHVKKLGAHCGDDPNCMNRYHPAIPPVMRAKTGQLIVFETRDALDSDLTVNSQPKDIGAIDLNLVHPLTGPVHIEGAKRGDVLAVTLVDIEPDEYGYTTVVPGFGFLRDMFTKPFIANWIDLEKEVCLVVGVMMDSKNAIGIKFNQIAEKLNIQANHDNFMANIILLQKDRLPEFLKEIGQC